VGEKSLTDFFAFLWPGQSSLGNGFLDILISGNPFTIREGREKPPTGDAK
jgi:hypothetical protein